MMFGFKKNVETKIEPEFENRSDETREQPQSLADILGARENDTNITAGVDAILDDTGDISEESGMTGADKIDFGMINNQEDAVDLDLDSYEDSSTEESSGYGELPEYLRGVSSEQSENQEIDEITDDISSVPFDNERAEYQEPEIYPETDENMKQAASSEPEPVREQIQDVYSADNHFDGEDITSGIEDITIPDGVTAVDDLLTTEDAANLSLDDILGDNSSYSVDDILQDKPVNTDKEPESDFEEMTVSESALAEEVPAAATEDFALPEVTSVFDDEPAAEPEFAEETPAAAKEDFTLPEVTSAFDDGPAAEPEFAEEVPTAATEDFALPEVTSVFDDEPAAEPEFTEEVPTAATEDFTLPEVTSAFDDEPAVEPELAEEVPAAEIETMPVINAPAVQTRANENICIGIKNIAWELTDLSYLSESPRVINRNSGFVTWNGDKYQRDIRVDIETPEEAGKWSLSLMNEFSVVLSEGISEVVIEKDDAVVRYASLVCDGVEKLKIFNQSSYKFIVPQDDFFSVQGNVICGRIDNSFALNITDYWDMPLEDKLNRYIRFVSPASGFITAPDGGRVFFANAEGIALVCAEKLPEAEVFEYVPSLKDFDNKNCFVFDEESDIKEFVANGKKKKLVVNTGTSLYGWNVRFDNDMTMSLRDALEYQSKYKQLPAKNGEIIHGTNSLKFFGIETLKARPKVVYYSYGRR